jgi:hypothetical protein
MVNGASMRWQNVSRHCAMCGPWCVIRRCRAS